MGMTRDMRRQQKNIRKKCKEQVKSYFDGLKALRNTLVSDKVPSPAQLLQGKTLPDSISRDIRVHFPSAYDKSEIEHEFDRVKSQQKYGIIERQDTAKGLQSSKPVKFRLNNECVLGTVPKHALYCYNYPYVYIHDKNKTNQQ